MKLINILKEIGDSSQIPSAAQFNVSENKGQAIKLMSYVVGSIEEWLKRYSKKYGEIQIVYIKYEPKFESEETQSIDSIKNDDVVNKRDKLYRAYIEKFAKKYGSSVTFKVAGGINANFNPMLKIN